MSLTQLAKHFGVSRQVLAGWLDGIPAPDWTARPGAKDQLRARARVLRADGLSVPKLAAELGVARSTAYQWTRDIPLDADTERAAQRRRRHARHMTETRWEPYRQARDSARAAENERSAAWVGELSEREVLLLGAVAYWCEGTKTKPWRPHDCRLQFINSDPVLILLFLRFVESLGVDRAALAYRLSIHKSADVDAAQRWWARCVGVPAESFQRPTLKVHKPATLRRNVGDSYRGCLTVYAPRAAALYWKVEGIMRGIALADNPGGDDRM
jgi:transcriptional regulator with XRE-family HTH domain